MKNITECMAQNARSWTTLLSISTPTRAIAAHCRNRERQAKQQRGSLINGINFSRAGIASDFALLESVLNATACTTPGATTTNGDTLLFVCSLLNNFQRDPERGLQCEKENNNGETFLNIAQNAYTGLLHGTDNTPTSMSEITTNHVPRLV